MVINCGFCSSQIVDLNDYDTFNRTSVRKVFLKCKFKIRIWFFSCFYKPFWLYTGLSINRLLSTISQSPYCGYFWCNFIICLNCRNFVLIDPHVRFIVVEVLIRVFFPIFFLYQKIFSESKHRIVIGIIKILREIQIHIKLILQEINITSFFGVPYGIRTRVAAVKGRCPEPLDEGDK